METRFFNRSSKIDCLGRKRVWQPLQYISLRRLLSVNSAIGNEKLWPCISVCIFISDNATMLHIYPYVYVYIINHMLGKYKTFQSHKGN